MEVFIVHLQRHSTATRKTSTYTEGVFTTSAKASRFVAREIARMKEQFGMHDVRRNVVGTAAGATWAYTITAMAVDSERAL
jgi:hypothetical protein